LDSKSKIIQESKVLAKNVSKEEGKIDACKPLYLRRYE